MEKITAEEAAGLWHAVEWMKLCLRHEDLTDPATLAVERKRLAAARRGLTKVQRARRATRNLDVQIQGRQEGS